MSLSYPTSTHFISESDEYLRSTDPHCVVFDFDK